MGRIALVGSPVVLGCILRDWASREKLCLLDQVSPGLVLQCQDEEPAGDLPEASEPVVLPSLSRFFLRHAEGLAPLRRLLSQIGRRDSILVGANPLAWHFLERTMGISAYFHPVLVPRAPTSSSPLVAPPLALALDLDSTACSLLRDLLIHESLAEELLLEISPATRGETQASIQKLESADVLNRKGGELRIIPDRWASTILSLKNRGWLELE